MRENLARRVLIWRLMLMFLVLLQFFDLVTISHAELGPLPLVYLIGTTTRSFLPGSLLVSGYYFMVPTLLPHMTSRKLVVEVCY
jgi:hypothetical protein